MENNAAPKIDYEALEKQRTQALQAQLRQRLSTREMGGKIDSLRRHVLKHVVEANYSEAEKIISEYVEQKSVYPNLRDRVEAQIRHAGELINAIRAKRNFPGLHMLSMSKQQEILDHAIHHFDELKYTLKAIEQIVRDEALKDVRSTVWVVRTAAYALIAIVATGFILDFSESLARPLWLVFNELTETTYSNLMKMLP